MFSQSISFKITTAKMVAHHDDMSMSMSMSGMAMPTASAHASHSMDDSMMHGMNMVFFTAHTTPLYSDAWTPRTIGQYAGTCFFLIFLSFLFRGLIALRFNFHSLFRGGVRLRETALLSADEEVKEVGKRPWSVNEAALRAVLDTTLAGVSYLL